ncbi:MAG TPA: helix-turn-helix transcriptional regulator, partial [Ktedonobacteraceae bacterium]|nr:helix-turn-helix transcriptional regulator [Ktedonobacteraceae bacterium]
QASLARKADIDFKTVKRLFRDPYHDVSLYILNKIAQALDVPTSALLEDVPDA